MKTLRFFFAAIAATALVFGCKPDDNQDDGNGNQHENTDPTPEPEKNPSITVNTDLTTFNFEAKAESVTFNVLANYDWTITKTGLEWCSVTPESGEADDLVTVKIAPQDNPDKAERQGTFTISIPGKDCSKEFTVIQEAKGEPKPVVIAKWQFTAIWVNEEPSAPTNKTNPNAEGAALATAWQNGQPVASNVVRGGFLSFVSTAATPVFTVGPATHKKDRFRAAYLNSNDYFLFSLDEIDLAAKDTLMFCNACVQIANVTKGPGKYALEYSYNKTDWTLLRDVAVNTSAANNPEPLDFKLEAAAAYKGPFYLRVRINGTKSANGTELEEGSEKTVFISVNDTNYPSTNSYDVRDAFYDEDWAYVYFAVKKSAE